MKEEKMSKLKYDVGADFLCRYADGMIYEAKCVELDTSKKSPLYFVHYKGWNNRWDEWVDDSRLLELNAANRKQAETNNKSVQEKLKSAKKSGKRPSLSQTPTAKSGDRSPSKSLASVTTAQSSKDNAENSEPPKKTPKIDSGETGLNQRRANKQQPGRDVKIPQQQLSRAKFREPPAGWKRGLEPLKAFCRFSVIKHQAFFIGPGGTQKLMSPDEVHKFCDEIGREFDVNEFDFTPIRQKSDITQDRAALILGQNRNRPPSATGATKKLPPVVANKKAVVPKTMVSQPSVADKPLSAPERLKRFETAKMAPQTKPAAVLPRKKSSVSASVLAPPKILSKKIRTPPPRISIKRSATKREYEGRPNLPRANKPNKVPSRSIGRPLAQEAQPTEVKAKRTVGPAGNVRKSKKEVEEILDDVRKITGLEVKSDTSEDKLHEEVDKSGENQPTSAAEPVRSNQRPHRNRRPSKRFSEESESDSPQDIPHTRSTHTSPVKRESIPSCSSERTFDDTIVSTVAQVARLPMGKNESPQRKRNANGSAIKMLAEAKKRRADAAVEARRLSQSYSSSPTRKSQSNRRANSESSLDEEDNYGESSDGKDFLSDDSDGPSKSRFLVRRSGGVKRTGPAFLRQKSAEIPIMPGTWASRQYLPTSPSKTKRSTPASSPSKERRRSGQGSRRREMTPDDPMISAPIAVPPAIMNDHNYSKGIVIGSEDLMTAATTAKDFPQQQTHNNSSAGIITTLSGFPMVSYTAGQPLQMSSGEKTNGGATLDTITLPYTSFGPNSGNSGNLPTSSSQAGPNSQLNSGVIVVAMNNQQQSASPQLLNTRGNMATISLPPPSSDDDYGGVGDISEFVSSFNAADFGHFSSQSALGRNSGKTVVAASTSRSVTAAVPTGNLTVGGAVQKPPVSRGEESDEEDDDGVKISFIDLKTGQLQTGSGRQIIHKTKFSQLQQPPPSTLSLIPRSVAIPPIVEDKLPANIFEGDDVATGGIEDEDKS